MIGLSERIFSVLKECLPSGEKLISLHEPQFAGNEWRYLKECLDTRWVSTAGSFVDRFEQALVATTGAKRAVAMVNGTAALHIALLLLGVQPGDEVIVPTLTFVATANAVAHCGAIPHFADSEEATLGLDVPKLAEYLHKTAEVKGDTCTNRRTGRPIKAVIPMHTFGHPVDLDPLVKLCSMFRLALVEDAAESLGSFYKGRHTGTFGRVGILSFNGNKIVTTGGGGAILTDDTDLADRVKHITTTARIPHAWEMAHDRVGYNYRLPNLNAALGSAQLEQLPEFVRRKRDLAARYHKAFENIAGVECFVEPEFAQSNYWLNVLLLDSQYAAERDPVLEITNRNGIMTRPAWKLLHGLPMFQHCPRMDLSIAENLEKRMINIPSSSFLQVSTESEG